MRLVPLVPPIADVSHPVPSGERLMDRFAASSEAVALQIARCDGFPNVGKTSETIAMVKNYTLQTPWRFKDVFSFEVKTFAAHQNPQLRGLDGLAMPSMRWHSCGPDFMDGKLLGFHRGHGLQLRFVAPQQR